jgi:hypothetical protein
VGRCSFDVEYSVCARAYVILIVHVLSTTEALSADIVLVSNTHT